MHIVCVFARMCMHVYVHVLCVALTNGQKTLFFYFLVVVFFDNREEAFIWLYANLLIKVNLVSVLELSLLKRFGMKNFCYTL